MQGVRKYPNSHNSLQLKEGEYGKNPKDGIWYARPPGQRMCSIANHDVTEHEDGTITVAPSILITGETGWHGFLERGVWREV